MKINTSNKEENQPLWKILGESTLNLTLSIQLAILNSHLFNQLPADIGPLDTLSMRLKH